MEDLIRGRFIRNILSDEGEKMLDRQTSRISAILEKRTGYLLDSRRIDISEASDNFEGELSFAHPAYERFLDIKKKTGKKRQNRKIHNTIVYSTYGRIASRLMTEFTEETKNAIREEFDAIKEAANKN